MYYVFILLQRRTKSELKMRKTLTHIVIRCISITKLNLDNNI